MIQSALYVYTLVREQADTVGALQGAGHSLDRIKKLPGKKADRIREIQATLAKEIPDLPTEVLAFELGPEKVRELFDAHRRAVLV